MGALVVGTLAACVGHKTQTPTPEATVPFPAGTLAGRDVGLLPFTLVLADDSLHWESQMADRPRVLAAGDSILLGFLTSRIPEVGWKAPARLWRSARGANDLPDDPHQLGVAILRRLAVGSYVPDPLRAQLRTLGAVAGGSYVLAPASLFFKVDSTRRESGVPKGLPDGRGSRPNATAEVTLVLVDVRLGQVSWRSVARGEGDDPWSALAHALKTLTPGMP
ncbi:MAG TPA: hypothetical protein VNX15_03120 [Gemmatimonadales bacterium]|nr:hypothetical protein [Gemmatimonadales bacterium]